MKVWKEEKTQQGALCKIQMTFCDLLIIPKYGPGKLNHVFHLVFPMKALAILVLNSLFSKQIYPSWLPHLS